MQETIDVVMQVETLVQQGINGKEIAIIYRNHAQAEDYNRTTLRKKRFLLIQKERSIFCNYPLLITLYFLHGSIGEKNIPYSGDEIFFKILHC